MAGQDPDYPGAGSIHYGRWISDDDSDVLGFAICMGASMGNLGARPEYSGGATQTEMM